MGMTEIKGLIEAWLLEQVLIIPLIIINKSKIGLYVDLCLLAMLMVIFIGLKLIGV